MTVFYKHLAPTGPTDALTHSALSAGSKGERNAAHVARIDAVSPDINTANSNKPSEILGSCACCEKNTGAMAATRRPISGEPAEKQQGILRHHHYRKVHRVVPYGAQQRRSRLLSNTLRKSTAAIPSVPRSKPSPPNIWKVER